MILTAKYKGSEVQVQFGTLPAKPATVYVTSPTIVGQAVAEISALTELKLARRTHRKASTTMVASCDHCIVASTTS